MAQKVKIEVTAETSDIDRLCNRIEMLSEVTHVEAEDGDDGNDGDKTGADMLVTCPGNVRRADVEELLKGIVGVSVEMLR